MPDAAQDGSQFSLFDTEAAAPDGSLPANAPKGKFSNFIAYVDKSGDHGMKSLDPSYPVFVLSFCVFYKRHYSEKVIPSLH